ncbi:hypothetical protein J7F03_28770 [Streptomyces sp. ISL-43]|uniref:ABC transporter substrate-binding protein n=1 Tax=Streptomyces sp. ISL-43 TaxID=2819183 RepID=UPI001BE810A3|nr:ABC transporter substrate-binding protein [Streptomyces sp. ISL-43]MBT2450999.1 hypothetical protein [Streptomyces sp. ISL-43]
MAVPNMPRRADGGGTLTVDLDAWPLSLDPYHVVDFNQALVLDALVDPLTRECSGAGPDGRPRVLPSAIEGLEPLDDGRAWRLTPAAGQTWPDGSPVTAGEIAAGVHRAWGPTGFPWPAAHAPGAGGSPVRSRVLAADTIEVRSDLPLPFLPEVLAFPGAAPVRESGDAWTATGPYRPYRADRRLGRIELRRRDSRRTRPGSAQALVFQVHSDRGRAEAAVADGRVDLSLNTGLRPADFARLAESERAYVTPLALACQLWVRPGTDSPLDLPAGRAEFGAGFDREAVSAALARTVLPLHRYSALWTPGGGRPLGADGPLRRRVPPPGGRSELTLTYADFPPNDDVARAIARDLTARFGHDVRHRPLSYREFADAVARLDYELLYCINPAPVAHPASLLTPFHSTSATARSLGFADAATDAALDRALREPGPDGGTRAWARAEDTVLRTAPVVPLFKVNSITLVRPQLAAPDIAPSGVMALERVFRRSPPTAIDRRDTTA